MIAQCKSIPFDEASDDLLRKLGISNSVVNSAKDPIDFLLLIFLGERSLGGRGSTTQEFGAGEE